MKNIVERLGFIAVIILLLSMFFSEKNTHKKDMVESNNLLVALHDSMTTYINDNGQLINEKKTLQTNYEILENENLNLTSSQKALLSEIKKLNKDNYLISAALIDTRIRLNRLIDSIEQTVIYDTNKITFNATSKYLTYNIDVFNVGRVGFGTPRLVMNDLSLDNRQLIEFHWENNVKLGYPVSFSVKNSNPYFVTSNIESYAIPNLKKESVDPTGWMKIKKWFNNNWDKSLYFAGGVGIGYLLK